MISKEERKQLKLARSKAELVRTVTALFQTIITSATLIILVYVNFIR
jgi:phenylpyruvate tautomerase PptA (4-oxalocrotonate tautomerase family)